MTLIFSNSSVHGVYFHAPPLKDIPLNGHSADDRTITLDEYDSSGRVYARFEGSFASSDPRGAYGGTNLDREVIIGDWRRMSETNRTPFYVRLSTAKIGTLDRRYYNVPDSDDEAIHRNAQQFWEAVRRNDKQVVAGLMWYPTTVRLADQRRLTIASSDQFVENYDLIFSSKFRQAIADALPRNMWDHYGSVMLGNGEVLFDGKGRVISLDASVPEGRPGDPN